jgi:hypothetical protein
MDTLDLGWYWSERQQEWQLAKLAQADRATHLYVIGATRSGKTKFLEFLIQQDIAATDDHGFGVIDPHGDLIEDSKGMLAVFAHQHRESSLCDRVVLIDPLHPHLTATFNPLERLPGTSAAEQAQELIACFKKIWADAWGVRMEDLMRHSLIALSEAGLTLAHVPRFLRDPDFRHEALQKVDHPLAQEYFRSFDRLTPRAQAEWAGPVMHKVNALLADERIRQLLSHPQSSFNLRDILDRRLILLVKLDKGKLKDAADLLGSLILAKLQMAAFSRSDLPQSQRIPFYLYIDEFQDFATETFGVLLSEAAKYRLALIMAHQTLHGQVPAELRSIILGNTGLQVCFRVNRQDAETLAKEFFEYSGYTVKTTHNLTAVFWSYAEEWEHHVQELQNQPPRHAWVKHKTAGGLIPIRTADITPPWEVLGLSEEAYWADLASLPIGRKYLVARRDLAAAVSMPTMPDRLPEDERRFLALICEQPELTVSAVYRTLAVSVDKGNRLRAALKARGLIQELETRLGKGGRLAKFCVPTLAAFPLLGLEPPGGRGGSLHRFLQRIVVDQAETKGYTAKPEHILPNGGIADVHLERAGERTAVEIAIASTLARELAHIKTCLAAGYPQVYAVFLNERLCAQVEAQVQAREEGEKVTCLPVGRLSALV